MPKEPEGALLPLPEMLKQSEALANEAGVKWLESLAGLYRAYERTEGGSQLRADLAALAGRTQALLHEQGTLKDELAEIVTRVLARRDK